MVLGSLCFLWLVSSLLIVEAFWTTSPNRPIQRTRQFMVRNIDYPEALIFYESLPTDSILLDTSDSKTPKDGLIGLLQECQDEKTPALLITGAANDKDVTTLYEKKLLNYFTICRPQMPSESSPSLPRVLLWDAIHSVIIQPEGFGGSSGFGRKAADPERSPLPARVVVFCNDVDVVKAARAVGMRVFCLHDQDEGLSDAILDDYANLYLQDIATPGSFWLNPPYPRDDEGNKVDVMSLVEEANVDDSIMEGEEQEEEESAQQEADRLRAILEDMDPL